VLLAVPSSVSNMTDPATPTSEQITLWLTHWQQGNHEASERLFAVVYPQLRRIAARFLRNERSDHTLEPSALVNELYVRLLGCEPITFKDRAHFFAIAAQTMRRILVDHARARFADKRGGDQQRVNFSSVEGWSPVSYSQDLLDLDQALSKLEKADPRAARVVELRFFGGLEEEEIAEVLKVSTITVKRDWKVARAWLIGRLQPPA
jgi:RNA polymerase sigma-70 factor (ECF subfamily)